MLSPPSLCSGGTWPFFFFPPPVTSKAPPKTGPPPSPRGLARPQPLLTVLGRKNIRPFSVPQILVLFWPCHYSNKGFFEEVATGTSPSNGIKNCISFFAPPLRGGNYLMIVVQVKSKLLFPSGAFLALPLRGRMICSTAHIRYWCSLALAPLRGRAFPMTCIGFSFYCTLTNFDFDGRNPIQSLCGCPPPAFHDG